MKTRVAVVLLASALSYSCGGSQSPVGVGAGSADTSSTSEQVAAPRDGSERLAQPVSLTDSKEHEFRGPDLPTDVSAFVKADDDQFAGMFCTGLRFQPLGSVGLQCAESSKWDSYTSFFSQRDPSSKEVVVLAITAPDIDELEFAYGDSTVRTSAIKLPELPQVSIFAASVPSRHATSVTGKSNGEVTLRSDRP